jgi:serine/threonine protein kinase
VVIKQFRFAQSASNWHEYRAYEAEVEMLKQLNHPGIPRYISSFETPDGFCMVQEYKPAPSLAEPRSWQPAAIKQVAIALLDILTYLQSQPVPVIHRDIKPENILVDDRRQVYLVDFGFARSGGEDLAASSLVKGTMGFMPPEQLFNRELTKASDLYSLGATLICLVTGVRSAQIGSLIQADYHIRFRDLVPPLHRGWLNWLEKLVEPHPQDRYPSAKAALLDLRTLNVSRAPKLKVDHSTLELQASRLGASLQQTVTLTNSIPDTHLSGHWDVVPHPHDPPHTPEAHPWIQVSPQYFEGNAVSCQVQVDTRGLQPGRSFHRQLRLHTNATQGVETIPILVRTAPLPARLPYGAMAVAMGVFFALGCWLFYHQPLTLTVALVVVPVLFATVDFAWSWNVQYGAIPATKAISYMVRRMTMTGLYAILAGVLSLLAVMALLSLLLVAAQKGLSGRRPW